MIGTEWCKLWKNGIDHRIIKKEIENTGKIRSIKKTGFKNVTEIKNRFEKN